MCVCVIVFVIVCVCNCVSPAGSKYPGAKQKDSAPVVRGGTAAVEELRDQTLYSYQQISCLDSVIRCVCGILTGISSYSLSFCSVIHTKQHNTNICIFLIIIIAIYFVYSTYPSVNFSL